MSRAEDFVFVALKRSNPGVDVRGVLLGIVGYPPLRGEEHAGQFRAKFLLRIVRVAETIGFGERGSVEARRVTGPVRQFMQRRAVVSRGVFEGVLRRQVDAVL